MSMASRQLRSVVQSVELLATSDRELALLAPRPPSVGVRPQ